MLREGRSRLTFISHESCNLCYVFSISSRYGVNTVIACFVIPRLVILTRASHYLSYISRSFPSTQQFCASGRAGSGASAEVPFDLSRRSEEQQTRPMRDSSGKFQPPLPAISQFRPGKSIYVSLPSQFPSLELHRQGLFVPPYGGGG